MSQLPLPDAIPRFKANEERIDIFVNGSASTSFTSSGGTTVPSIQKFLADKNAEFNITNNYAYKWANEAENTQVNDGTRTGYSAYHWAKKAEGFAGGTAFVQKTGDTMTGRLVMSASVAAAAPFQMPHGVAPTTPVNGEMWSTTAGIFARVNGATFNMTLAQVTQAVAEAGTDTNSFYWSSLRVRQAVIAAPVGTATQTALNDKVSKTTDKGTSADITAGTADKFPDAAAVKAALAANVSPGVGIGQTWKTVSRGGGAAYQNGGTKPKQISARANRSSVIYFQVSADGATWVNVSKSEFHMTSTSGTGENILQVSGIIIPVGHYARINDGGAVNIAWAELD